MTQRYSLQQRLGLALSLLLLLVWIGAAWMTVIKTRAEMNRVFDSALQETAQRILPLVVVELIGRDQLDVTQRSAAIREHKEFLTYLVRDERGRILLLSHDADLNTFPSWQAVGFSQSTSHRFYNEEALEGSIRLTIAEPLAYRQSLVRQIQTGFWTPLFIFFPISLLIVYVAVRVSLLPLRRFRERLALRGPQDLSSISIEDSPAEILPIVETINGLLKRLSAAFDAERHFAAHAAHEIRTPLAGAIAQAQRLQLESSDVAVRRRALDIETTLKRLTRLSERLMQLARVEGGSLRKDYPSDLKFVSSILIDELKRTFGEGLIILEVPTEPLLSDIDPDVFAILLRNLIENALRHGDINSPCHVLLTPDGQLIVTNHGLVVPKADLDRLVNRFERLGDNKEGSGLGLAIVYSISERLDLKLNLSSPIPGQLEGFQVSLSLPVDRSDRA